MRPNRAPLALAALSIIAVMAPRAALAQPDDGPIDAAQVLAAIERGVAYLKREQLPRGRWNEMGGYEGGVTALCTLALLNSGVGPDDPVVRQALTYLRGLQLDKTYTVSLQTMVLAAAEPKKDMVLIGRNVRWLEQNQIKEGPRKGAWSYPGPGGDNSNAQFAILALYDAQRVGAQVNRQTWELAADYWRRTQNDDGSWGYVPGDTGTGSMTCAGIGGLAICSAALESGDAAVEDGRVICCRPHQEDHKLDMAIDWLASRFSVTRNPRPAAANRRCTTISTVWNAPADSQHAASSASTIGIAKVPSSWCAIRIRSRTIGREAGMPSATRTSARRWRCCFLSKGRRPIVMAKLKYGDDNMWNQHRSDAAHLAAYTEEAWELGLTWQIMDPSAATVEDLLQAPVLYISGSRAPDLLPHAKKLRDYVDRGGFIFAEACCSDSARFDEGFRQLMAAVFAEPEYQLQQITPGHPIWRMQDMVRPDSPYAGRLWGVEYGCRTCVVYSEQDLSCYWELAQPGQWRRHPQAVNEHIADALAIGVNVLTYATNREPKGKEQSFVMASEEDDIDSKTSRGVIEVAKLRHGGGCNDAPGRS